MSKENSLNEGRLMLLITIVNRSKAEFYLDLLQSFEINLQLSAMAYGTATPDIKKQLSLTNTDKAVLFSVIREDKADDALFSLQEKFDSIRDGKGIAFTIPFDGMIGVNAYSFLSNRQKIIREAT